MTENKIELISEVELKHFVTTEREKMAPDGSMRCQQKVGKMPVGYQQTLIQCSVHNIWYVIRLGN